MPVVPRFLEVVQTPLGVDIMNSPLFEGLLRACRMLPRGKGAVARVLGRIILRDRCFARAMPAGYDMLWTSLSIDLLVNALTVGWDEHVLQAIEAAVKPGDVFYDVGANAGYMSLSLANHQPSAKIFAFEPLPALAGALAASARRNGFEHLDVVRAVLTDRDGPIDFFLPSHSIHASLISREESGKRLRVEGFRLDSLIEGGVIPPPNVIKIDVEGAEMLVFQGAEKTLERFTPILIFECDANATRFSHSPDHVLEFLQKIGYNKFIHLQYPDLNIGAEGRFRDTPFGDFVASRG